MNSESKKVRNENEELINENSDKSKTATIDVKAEDELTDQETKQEDVGSCCGFCN